MKVGICIPSRGLIHSRTIESVLKNTKGFDDWFIKISHDRPIPTAHNFLAKYAYKRNADYIIFVEEDNVIPNGMFKKMIQQADKSSHGVIACDYPVGSKRFSTIKRENGLVKWCGFGCTLIKRYVFDQLSYPFFETGKSLRILPDGSRELINIPNKYGGHDILFGLRLETERITIGVMKEQVGHLRVKRQGKDGYNNGIHNIEDMGEVVEYGSI